LKILFIDCFSGLSLDMLLGALLQLGVAENLLRSQLAKINTGSYRINIYDEKDFSVAAKRIEIITGDSPPDYDTRQIVDLLENSDLSSFVKKICAETFLRLAMTRAKVTGLPLEPIVIENSLGSLVLLVGIAVCIEQLAPDKIMMQSLPLGSGLVKVNDTWLPVPVPVTAELVKGLPVQLGPVEGELVRPLEASLVNVLVDEFAPPPVMAPFAIGYGKGSLQLPIPHLLRVMLGSAETPCGYLEEIATLETNIDDMNPEFYPYIMELFLKKGALDVFLTPVIMKKGRPGTKLSVLCKTGDVKYLANLILKETSTLGVRIGYQNRTTALREMMKVNTRYGPVGVKVARLHPGEPVLRITPEYEDCKAAAQAYGVPISQVYQETLKEADALKENL